MVTEKMIEALKPCPFCGGNPELLDDRLVFFVRCDSCKPLPTVIYGENYRHLDQINDEAEAQASIDGVDWQEARQTAIDAWNRRHEAALSTDAEPVAFTSQGQLDEARKGSTALPYGKRDEFMDIALYTAPPAPSVAVKALEWAYTERAVATYIAKDDRGDMYWINQSFGSDSYYFTTIRRVDGKTLYDADDLDSAKAAAQADYEARIRSALSAQVQDVATYSLIGYTHVTPCPKLGREVFFSPYKPEGNIDWQEVYVRSAPAAKQGEAE